MKTKIKLLLGLLLTIFITLPVTCNAEEVPTMKWEELTEDTGYSSIHSGLYNINDDILVVHNVSTYSNGNGNYIRLYKSFGEIKWEQEQESIMRPYFLINNEYLGIIDYLWTSTSSSEKYITLLNIKDGTIYKKINISEIVRTVNSYASVYSNFIEIYPYYYNNKIIILFYDGLGAKKYYFYKLDLDGNIEIKKSESVNIDRYSNNQIVIDNTFYSIDDDNIIAISMDTGEIISTTPTNNNIDIINIVKYKDGIMYCGSIDGYMALEYYNLKNGTSQVKQFEEEGEIYTITTDDKDNLYIAGKYIDDNTTGKAYFSKYIVNTWDFQKVYESFYEKEEYDEYFFTDILALKNNKLVLSGNTQDTGKYRTGLNFVVYYDENKIFKIDKVIKGNGHIDIVEKEKEDNEVKYQVKPGFGYKLISLKIVTASGKEIEVSDDYSFIMPNENITITVVFEPIISNPVTSSNILKIFLILTISISLVYLITKSIRKRKFNN